MAVFFSFRTSPDWQKAPSRGMATNGLRGRLAQRRLQGQKEPDPGGHMVLSQCLFSGSALAAPWGHSPFPALPKEMPLESLPPSVFFATLI